MHASDGGGAMTYTGGAPWTSRDYPTAQYYHAITTKHLPYHVCGAQQDGSTVCVSSEPAGAGGEAEDAEVEAERAGAAETRRCCRGAGDVQPGRRGARVHRARSRRIPTSSSRAATTDRSSSTRIAAQARPAKSIRIRACSRASRRARFPSACSGRIPIVFSPADPNVLFTATQHVWKTTNNGLDWTRISGDLTTPRSQDDRPLGRPDHRRHERAGGLRDGLRTGAVEDRRQHDLGRIGRWHDPRDARRRKELGARHAARTCRSSAA